MKKICHNIFNVLNKDLVLCLVEFGRYMSKVLKLEDFEWIIVNSEKQSGYYSFKKDCWEIALDLNSRNIWSVYLCNKFEEVLEEYGCWDQNDALNIANKIYKSLI